MSAGQRQGRWWLRGLVALVTASCLLAPTSPGRRTRQRGRRVVGRRRFGPRGVPPHASRRSRRPATPSRRRRSGSTTSVNRSPTSTATSPTSKRSSTPRRRSSTPKQAALDATEQSLADVESRLAVEQQRLRNQAIEAYVGGGATPVPDFVAALKNAGSLEDVAKSQVYAEAVVVDRKAVVKRVSDLRSQADSLRAKANDDRQAAADCTRRGRRSPRRPRADADPASRRAGRGRSTRRPSSSGWAKRSRRGAAPTSWRTPSRSVSPTRSPQMLARWQKDQPPATETYGIFLDPIKNGKIVSGYGPRLHPIYNVVAAAQRPRSRRSDG